MAAAAAEVRRLEGAWEGSAPITVRPLRHPTTSSQRRPSMPRESENVSAGAGLRVCMMLRGQTLTFAKIETIIITLLFTLLCYCHCIDINIVTLLLLQ